MDRLKVQHLLQKSTAEKQFYTFTKARFDPFRIAYCVLALLKSITLRHGYSNPKMSNYLHPDTKIIRK